MADNTQLNPGTGGDLIATDDVGGVKYQRVKVAHGIDGAAVDASASNPLPVTPSAAGTQRDIFSRYLDTTGDGTGTKNANGNYSAGAQIFKIQPAAGVVYRVARMLITIEDTVGMAATDYGNIAGALTNGVQVRTADTSGTLVDLTDGLPVKINAGWGSLCFDVDVKAWSTGNELLLARWTFAKHGQFLRLDGDNSERLEVVLNDDLTGLVQHYFLAQGYVEA